MGNRFRALAEYQPLITAHGTIAAITFIGIVPAAILIARFYYPNPRLALRIHISLQIFTVILSTVVLILGYFAVGPERSLKNPHHGIGVAIYVLVLIQAIGGWLVHKIEKGKMRYHVPIKLMVGCNTVSGPNYILTGLPATPVAWQSYRTSRAGSDTHWAYIIRLANRVVCPLYTSNDILSCTIFCTHLPALQTRS